MIKNQKHKQKFIEDFEKIINSFLTFSTIVFAGIGIGLLTYSIDKNLVSTLFIVSFCLILITGRLIGLMPYIFKKEVNK